MGSTMLIIAVVLVLLASWTFFIVTEGFRGLAKILLIISFVVLANGIRVLVRGETLPLVAWIIFCLIFLLSFIVAIILFVKQRCD